MHLESLQPVFNERFNQSFFVTINCPVLVAFITTEYASAQKVVQTVYSSFAAFKSGLSQNHIYFMFKGIIYRTLNIVWINTKKK